MVDLLPTFVKGNEEWLPKFTHPELPHPIEMNNSF